MSSEPPKIGQRSQEILFSCTTVFPFTVFPTHLELTAERLTIKRMILPFTYRTTPVFVKDIAIVRLNETPFFSTLSFEMMAMAEDPQPVRFLRPADARKMEALLVDRIGKTK